MHFGPDVTEAFIKAGAFIKPYTFDTVGLQEQSWEPQKMFVRILHQISGLRDALILTDG